MLKDKFLTTVCAAALAASLSSAAIANESSDWEGFYGGVHVGYGIANVDPSYGDDASSSAAQRVENLDGALVGGHLGYNWDWTQNTVVGVEADYDFQIFNWEQRNVIWNSDGYTGDSNFLASLRARLGMAVGNDALLYITGGVAYTDAEVVLHAGTSNSEPAEWDWGGVFGAGIEHRISDNLTMRAEGLYYMFGEEDWICNTSCSVNTGSPQGKLDLDVFTFRIGFSYAWGGY